MFVDGPTFCRPCIVVVEFLVQLGGFVIHGNNVTTLGETVDALKACCDEVIAVDSNSTDGSAALVAAKGVPVLHRSWEGFGVARAIAAQALSHCDYLFFLDADESLSQRAIAAVRAWKASEPTRGYYRLRRNDWVELPTGRFLFRREHRKRLVRIDVAQWRSDMIVHEALPDGGDHADLDIAIEHRFVTTLEDRREREELYALLWALRRFGERQLPSGTGGRRAWHWFRSAVLKGAALRGGLVGAQLAWLIADGHARKYDYLRDIWDGRYPTLVEAWGAQDLARVLRLAREISHAVCASGAADVQLLSPATRR